MPLSVYHQIPNWLGVSLQFYESAIFRAVISLYLSFLVGRGTDASLAYESDSDFWNAEPRELVLLVSLHRALDASGFDYRFLHMHRDMKISPLTIT